MKNFAILLLIGAISLKEFAEATQLTNQAKLDAKFLDDDDDEDTKPEVNANALIDISD